MGYLDGKGKFDSKKWLRKKRLKNNDTKIKRNI